MLPLTHRLRPLGAVNRAPSWFSTTMVVIVALGVMPDASSADIDQLEKSYRFLVTERAESGGALYRVAAASAKGNALPLSFYDTGGYWGDYVCASSSCAVVDTYDPANHTVSPESAAAGALQLERIMTHNGSSIYDAATWQIAVVLGDVADRFGTQSQGGAYALVTYQNRRLRGAEPESSDGPNAGPVRATTNGASFVYNGRAIDRPSEAYAFRMLPRAWLSTDPLMETRHASLIEASRMPVGNPDYRPGKVSWPDWKPITGENAWAFLIGPLQAAHIHYVRGSRAKFVPFRDLAIQNALGILPTFAIMQSPIGAVYYAPSGTFSNKGAVSVNPHEVSVENNVSLYAGLRLFERLLRAELESDRELTDPERGSIRAAMATIDTIVHGGTRSDGQVTKGLMAFLRNSAWHAGEFVQGGVANDPTATDEWLPTLTTRAVDVNTWGVAALGTRQIDQWFGFGASFRAWQSVKRWGGYGVGETLWGVGYSDRDGNGSDAHGVYGQGVLSSEWTAGAITMVRNMLRYYGSLPSGTADYAASRQFVRLLELDERNMLQNVQSLRFSTYRTTEFPGKPARYSTLVTQSSEPYVYASKRYLIPFGWYANPLPSTCATAWIIMVANRYDPFGYDGTPN